MKSFSKILSLLIFVSLAGCLPKEVPLVTSEDSPSTGYSGFNGITAAETVNGTRVSVSWTPSSDPSVVAYNIYDSTFKFAPVLVKTISAPADRATLSGLSNQNLYSFRVRAANAKNEEDSNTKDLQAIPYGGISSVEVISSTQARVNFPDGSNADRINVYCKESSATNYDLYAQIYNTNLTQTTLSDLVPGTSYTCRVAIEIDGFVDNNPATQTFTPMGQASSIVFNTQPGNGAAGSPLSVQPVVRILDANGNLVAGGPDSTATITLTVANSSPTTGNVKGTFSVSAVGGIATFTDIFLEEAGQKILTATKSDTSSLFFGTGEMTVNSNNFNITPGAVSPDQTILAISPAPPDPARVANGIESYTVTFTLKDQFGNNVSGIKPTFSSNIVGDTLSQPTLNSNASGQTSGSISTTVADFAPNLRVLSISSPSGLSAVTVNANFVPGPATRLAYTVQPMNSPAGIMGLNQLTVEVQDAQGNRIRTGAASTAEISLSIASNVNGAVLSGTITKNAADGTATFSDLGIDLTGTGYRLVASSGSLTPAFSNTFNITAGIPKKIAISGPANVVSNVCSSAITIQLQDLGNNPANAIQSTPVTLSGFGDGSFYTSNTCGGAAIGSSTTFTAGTNTRTLYYRGNSAQALTIVASDTSSVMSSGQHSMTVSPNKVSMIAQAAAPAAPGTPLSVIAGQCSTQIVITPMGNNNNPGPTFIPTPVSITGLLGSGASLYTDAGCTNLIADPLAVTLPINSGPDFTTKIYLKDPKAESLMISVSDPSSVMTTTTSPQSVIVLPSRLNLTGPTSVVAGQCSSVFTIQMRDEQGNPATALENKVLDINGIPDTSVGRLFTSPACSGTGSRTTLTFPQGNTSLQVYFRSVSSDNLNISISDPAGALLTSQSVNLIVSPSALRVVAPGAGSANTNICAGPFYIDTLDAVGELTNAVASIQVNLSGAGTSAAYYSNSDCSSEINSVTFSVGQNRKSVYVMGYYPESLLTLTATDNASVLSPGTANWTITPAKGWLGTASTAVDSNNNPIWFRANAKTVAGRTDGIFSANALAMSPDNNYLYVVDYDRHRVSKYDYANGTYIGWIGQYHSSGGIPISGSNLPTPSIAACVATVNAAITPGWCTGGTSGASGNLGTLGAMYYPLDVVDDGNFIYVVNYQGNNVTRYNSNTGAFDGYIGLITSNAGMSPATGGPATCNTAANGTVTPGWCRGGTQNSGDVGNPMTMDGRLRYPYAITYDDDYIYVLNRQSVNRYNKASGAFAGWIGMVSSTPTSGAAGCSTTPANQLTPGWCFGGAAIQATPTGHLGIIGGMSVPREIYLYNDMIHVVHSTGVIIRYDKTSGARHPTEPYLPNAAMNWHAVTQVTSDGSNLYFADERRVIKTSFDGLLEGWIGKISSNTGMSGPGCTGLAVNANTPGWCLGGSARPGMDDRSFMSATGIVYDGNGRVLVGQSSGFGQIRRYNTTTGAYEDTLSLESMSPKKWTDNGTLITARHGFDDDSMYNPQGVHAAGDFIFAAELNSSRVKKFLRKTGELLGWIGGITTSPTGGAAGCIGANSYTASPGWCLGAFFQPWNYWNAAGMINTTTNGVMRSPSGIASDGTYIYVTDANLHRINRYLITTGAPAGWIGWITTSPTGGDAGCNGAAAGTFTPGWCMGGMSTNSTGSGGMWGPYGILYHGGNLYVADSGTHRVLSYTAATGAFNGWIGRINAAPSVCTTASNGEYTVSTSGWCVGGTSQAGDTSDNGGGFNFWGTSYRSGITTDGVYLYIANFRNIRVDRYTFGGVYMGSARTRHDIYTTTFSNVPATVAGFGVNQCSYPMTIWANSTHLYATLHQPCNAGNGSFAVAKMKLSMGVPAEDGLIDGWQAGIDPAFLPNDGDPGCAGATGFTPGWCKNGRPAVGLTIGTFSGNQGDITGDEHFVYVADEVGNRITRMPK